MSWFTVFVFAVGVLVGVFLTCLVVASDDGERDEEVDALIYKAGFEKGYRQGKRDREE